MGLFLIAWFLLIIIGMQKTDRTVQEVLRIEQVNVLKGICAVEIMIGHIGLQTNDLVLYANRKAGILFVGVFLFLSGYGLMYSRDHKEGYMKGFIIKRSVRILLPAYVIYVLIQFVEVVLEQDLSIFWNIIDIHNFIVSNNWFIWEILGFYILFGLLFWMEKHWKVLGGVLIGLSVIFIIVAFWMRIANPWYGSTLCFGLGIVFYLYRDRLSFICCRCFGKVVMVSGVVTLACIALFFWLGNDSFIGNPVARNMAAASFCIMVVTILQKVMLKNYATMWLGVCSYEIFLVHPYVLAIVSNRIGNRIVYILVVVASTVFLAFGSHHLMEIICKRGKENGK